MGKTGWDEAGSSGGSTEWEDVHRGFRKCREGQAQRPEGIQAEMQAVGGLRLAEEPGRMQERERSCKQGRWGSLGPRGGGRGIRLGSPHQGRDGPMAAPNRKKKSLGVWGQSPSLIHTQVDDAGGDDD